MQMIVRHRGAILHPMPDQVVREKRMLQAPQYVLDRIAAAIKEVDERLPAHVDHGPYKVMVADKVVKEYEAKQSLRRNPAADSAAVSWLFRFIDDAPQDAVALYRGSRVGH